MGWSLALALLLGSLGGGQLRAQARHRDQAQWLIDLARSEGHLSTEPDAATVQRLIALLRAAVRLDDRASVGHLLLADTYEQLGQFPQARDALNRYLQLEPRDSVIYHRWLGLASAEFDTADDRLAFLESLIEAPGLDPEAGAIVYTSLARLHAQRGDRQRAAMLLERALQKNRHNLDALQMQYDLIQGPPTTAQYVQYRLDLIAAKPLSVNLMWELGRYLDQRGLHRFAQFWYQRTGLVHSRANPGQLPPAEFRTDLVRSLFDTGAFETAAALAEQVNTPPPPPEPEAPEGEEPIDGEGTDEPTGGPTPQPFKINLPVLLIQADALGVLERPEESEAVISRAGEELAERLAAAQAQQGPQAQGEPADLWVDAAWFYLFYQTDPTRAFDYATRAAELAPEHPMVLRALGMAYLAQENLAKAEALLKPLAEQDQTAAWGLARILLATDRTEQAAERLQQALPMRFTGWTALRIRQLLEELEIEPPEPAPDAELERVLRNFNRASLAFQEQPQGSARLGMYPEQAESTVPAPMRVRFVLANKARFDLCMGPEQMFLPQATLSARLDTAAGPVPFPQYSSVTLARRQVLGRASEIVTRQTIQVGRLDRYLRTRPQMGARLYLRAVVDPKTRGPEDEQLNPGAGGWFSGPITIIRRPLKVSGESLGTLVEQLQGRNTAQRIRAVRVLAALVAERQLTEAERPYPHRRVDAEKVTQILLTLGVRDGDWQVRAALAEAVSLIALTDEQVRTLKPLLTDEHWLVRMLILRSLAGHQPKRYQRLLALFATRDGDPLVRQMAASYRTSPTTP